MSFLSTSEQNHMMRIRRDNGTKDPLVSSIAVAFAGDDMNFMAGFWLSYTGHTDVGDP